MSGGFFSQAVAHALDRYQQRTLTREQIASHEQMAGAELKEKYYYADIIKQSHERQAELDSQRNLIAERDMRLREAQADVNNEMVPLQNFKGVPGMIMQGFSPDGKSVRRGDVPSMMQSYVGWLQATKINQAENWRMSMLQKQMADADVDRRNLYALMGAAAEGAPENVPSIEETVKRRTDLGHFARKQAADLMNPTGALFGEYGVNNLVASLAGVVSPGSSGTLLPEETKAYKDTLTGLSTQLDNVNAVLDAFSDPRVNARLTPEMIGILSSVKDKYDAVMPTLSRFADEPTRKMLDQKAKRIGRTISAMQYPDLWKLELSTADDRIRAEAQLRRQELANEGRR